MREQKRKELIEKLAGTHKAEALIETVRKEITKLQKEATLESQDMSDVEGARKAIERLKNIIRILHANEDKDKQETIGEQEQDEEVKNDFR